jgi:hypothetical protein
MYIVLGCLGITKFEFLQAFVILISVGQLGLIPTKNFNCHSRGMNELLLLSNVQYN